MSLFKNTSRKIPRVSNIQRPSPSMQKTSSSHYNNDIDMLDIIIKICKRNKNNEREMFYLANILNHLTSYNGNIDDLEKARDYLNILINEKNK